MRRAQRRLCRRAKDGRNRDKARHVVAKIYERVTNTRRDFLHKTTTSLVKNQDYDAFAIENLDIQRLKREGTNGRSRSISSVGWGIFRQFLTYKCERAGTSVLVIGRFEPSSKTCSCEYVNDALKLSDREWDCPVCNTHHKRDHLAAQNIRRFAFRKQNPSHQSVARESREITPTESCNSGSLKWEAEIVGDSPHV